MDVDQISKQKGGFYFRALKFSRSQFPPLIFFLLGSKEIVESYGKGGLIGALRPFGG